MFMLLIVLFSRMCESALAVIYLYHRYVCLVRQNKFQRVGDSCGSCWQPTGRQRAGDEATSL